MGLLGGGLLGFMGCWLATAHAAAPSPHLCTGTEQVVFACPVNGKRVSVCATPDASAQQGRLTYRFGPDAPSAPELQLPDPATPPARAATGQTEAYSGGGGAWLRFAKGPYTYTVFTGVGRWGPKGQPLEKEGVLVQRQGKTVAHLPCTAAASSELSPDWYERMGVHAGDQAFVLP